MRKGQLPKGIGVLLAGDRETDAGRCHRLGSDFSYEEAAAQRYILWPNHIAGGMNSMPHVSLMPSPALSLSVALQGPVGEKQRAW